MERIQLKVALKLLENAGIGACLVGEFALNYYNVPRVLHDFEICVAEAAVEEATKLLKGTGLFESSELEQFDIYNEYKRGSPRLRSSSWITPVCAIVIFADTNYGLDPLLDRIVPKDSFGSHPVCSSQVSDLIPVDEIAQFPLPRLPHLFWGLCQRYANLHDDIAMIAAEQLVDGMDLDEAWCERNLQHASPAVRQLANSLIASKRSRMDDFSSNTVTCFICNEDEARRIQSIPGYE